MMVSRRDLLRIGLGLVLFAPAIVRRGFLLPSRTHGNLTPNHNIFVVVGWKEISLSPIHPSLEAL